MSAGLCKRCGLPLARPEGQAASIRETLAELRQMRQPAEPDWVAAYMEAELRFLLAWLEGTCSFCVADDMRAERAA